MKLWFRNPLFHLLLYCMAQTLGVKIQSEPEVSNGGVIQTELQKTVSLVCLTDAASETEAEDELVWLRNGAAISLMEGNKLGSSKVCVTPVLHEDNGVTFTCHLRHNATATASVTLNVTYHPQLSGSEEVAVEEDSVLVLQCDIWGNPPVSSVSWTLNGSTVDLLTGGFTVTNDGFKSKLSVSSSSVDKTVKFPLMPMIAGLVVVCLTAILAVVSRWSKIVKCCK